MIKIPFEIKSLFQSLAHSLIHPIKYLCVYMNWMEEVVTFEIDVNSNLLIHNE